MYINVLDNNPQSRYPCDDFISTVSFAQGVGIRTKCRKAAVRIPHPAVQRNIPALFKAP